MNQPNVRKMYAQKTVRRLVAVLAIILVYVREEIRFAFFRVDWLLFPEDAFVSAVNGSSNDVPEQDEFYVEANATFRITQNATFGKSLEISQWNLTQAPLPSHATNESEYHPQRIDTSMIDHIYYINLDKNTQRRKNMEKWLSKLPMEYQRVSAMRGNETTCNKHKQGERCVGLSGLAYTNLHIMNSLNVSGLTLVLEDDFVVKNMSRLISSIQLVPDDWDVLRWDCRTTPLQQFQRMGSVFKSGPVDRSKCTSEEETSGNCYYCGGTHVTLWREESIPKLRRVWEQQPFDDIDCRLTDWSLKTYCIQIGVGKFKKPKYERTDIPRG